MEGNSEFGEKVAKGLNILEQIGAFLRSDIKERTEAFRELSGREIDEKALRDFLLIPDDDVLQQYPHLTYLMTQFPLVKELPLDEENMTEKEVTLADKIIGKTVNLGPAYNYFDKKDPRLLRLEISRERAIALMHEYLEDKTGIRANEMVQSEFRFQLASLLSEYGIEIPEHLKLYVSRDVDELAGGLYDAAFINVAQFLGEESLKIYDRILERYKDQGVDEKIALRLAKIELDRMRHLDVETDELERGEIREELERFIKEYRNPSDFVFNIFGMNRNGDFPKEIAPGR